MCGLGGCRRIGGHCDEIIVIKAALCIALDDNFLNNQIVPATATNAPVRKWMARWVVWMQNTVLAYGFFA